MILYMRIDGIGIGFQKTNNKEAIPTSTVHVAQLN